MHINFLSQINVGINYYNGDVEYQTLSHESPGFNDIAAVSKPELFCSLDDVSIHLNEYVAENTAYSTFFVCNSKCN